MRITQFHSVTKLPEYLAEVYINEAESVSPRMPALKNFEIFIVVLLFPCSIMVAMWLLEEPDGYARVVGISLTCALVVMFLVTELEWHYINRYFKEKKLIDTDKAVQISNHVFPVLCLTLAALVYYFLMEWPGPAKFTTRIILLGLVLLYGVKVLEWHVAMIINRKVRTPSGKLLTEVDDLPDNYDDEIALTSMALHSSRVQGDMANYFQNLNMLPKGVVSGKTEASTGKILSIVKSD